MAVRSSHGVVANARSLVYAMASRRGKRPLLQSIVSNLADRRFLYAVTTVALLASKLVHLYTHRASLPAIRWHLFLYSFFGQDMALLVFLRLLLESWPSARVRLATTPLAAVLMAYLVVLGIVDVSFFAASGSQIHWSNLAFATSDASSRALLLTGLVSFLVVVGAVFAAGWVLRGVCWSAASCAADFFKLPFERANNQIIRRIPPMTYSQVSQDDMEYAAPEDEVKLIHLGDETRPRRSVVGFLFALILAWLPHILAFCAMLAQAIFAYLRPIEMSLIFMAWTPAVLPFVDFSLSSPNLAGLEPLYGSSIGQSWDNMTALAEPLSFPWLSQGLPGFEDWDGNRTHYSAAEDPLKISNLNNDLRDMLRDKLADVPIRHVMLIFLEGTRKDLFPVKKDGLIWETLTNSFANKSLPADAQKLLSKLTPTANYLTGDYEDGFEHTEQKRRGGINFNNAYTTGTYTLKSVTGTMCGITPLLADYNMDFFHHIYQPCLPHIFDAFNEIDEDEDAEDGYKSFKWHPWFMQSVVLEFDNFDKLMRSIGFTDENTISKEYLRSSSAKFGPVTLPDLGYFNMDETPIEDYIRDAFTTAKENDERAFITHITSTSHHPFKLPDSETYVPLADGLDELSHYVNTIGYDDGWLARVLDALEDEGVADETLLVLVGDHGLSLPETGVTTTYYNYNVGNFHVPLVLSHPKLPAIDVDDPVSSSQILPTILDLLLETGSLSKSQSQAAKDLVQNYEGQSLIRPMETSSPQGQGDWQLSVVTPGRAVIAMRDTRHPERRLIVPIIKNVEWRYTDVGADPTEEDPVVRFDFTSFLENVELEHGLEAAKWAEEGAFVARWWVEEHYKRWRFGPYSD